ncbi:unnamed protein product [Cuscuta epithymum]|uniref:Uncharacterized protein n=1 Tax=Cuscuta epithymum TaxID=186058 RepID=A0AAV0G928_9ASTE|nr:unnamed protein product [Cuscuta epithymum]
MSVSADSSCCFALDILDPIVPLDKLQEDELENHAYESAEVCKKRTNLFQHKSILRKDFKPGIKVLLLDSRLRFLPGKIKFKWTGPFVIRRVFPDGAIELENPKSGNIFKVNGERVKRYSCSEDSVEQVESLELLWEHFCSCI